MLSITEALQLIDIDRVKDNLEQQKLIISLKSY